MIWSSETKEKLHKTVSDVMGMYDVMPTLGNMLGVYNKYALGHDVFQIGSNNIVVFPNGNWVTNSIYYNAQKESTLSLAETAISADYIEKNNEYADEILNTSNSLITFDLIQKTQEGLSSEVEYGRKEKLTMKLKKGVKRFLIVLLIVLILTAVILWFVFGRGEKKQEPQTATVVETLDDYGYSLRSDATSLQKSLFEELKQVLNVEPINEEEYAKIVARSFYR